MREAQAPTAKMPCREATAVRKIRDPKDDRRWRHNARRRFPAFPFRSRCLPVSSFMLRPSHLSGRKDSFHRKKPVIDDGCNGGDWAMNPFCPLSPMSEDASKFVIGNDVTVIPEYVHVLFHPNDIRTQSLLYALSLGISIWASGRGCQK